MIDHGAKIQTVPVEGWYDAGKPETLLETNRHVLSTTRGKRPAREGGGDGPRPGPRGRRRGAGGLRDRPQRHHLARTRRARLAPARHHRGRGRPHRGLPAPRLAGRQPAPRCAASAGRWTWATTRSSWKPRVSEPRPAHARRRGEHGQERPLQAERRVRGRRTTPRACGCRPRLAARAEGDGGDAERHGHVRVGGGGDQLAAGSRTSRVACSGRAHQAGRRGGCRRRGGADALDLQREPARCPACAAGSPRHAPRATASRAPPPAAPARASSSLRRSSSSHASAGDGVDARAAAPDRATVSVVRRRRRAAPARRAPPPPGPARGPGWRRPSRPRSGRRRRATRTRRRRAPDGPVHDAAQPRAVQRHEAPRRPRAATLRAEEVLHPAQVAQPLLAHRGRRTRGGGAWEARASTSTRASGEQRRQPAGVVGDPRARRPAPPRRRGVRSVPGRRRRCPGAPRPPRGAPSGAPPGSGASTLPASSSRHVRQAQRPEALAQVRRARRSSCEGRRGDLRDRGPAPRSVSSSLPHARARARGRAAESDLPGASMPRRLGGRRPERWRRRGAAATVGAPVAFTGSASLSCVRAGECRSARDRPRPRRCPCPSERTHRPPLQERPCKSTS